MNVAVVAERPSVARDIARVLSAAQQFRGMGSVADGREAEGYPMNLTFEIPDDVAIRLSVAGGDLPRRALEALVAEEYRQRRLTKPDLRRLLGLKAHEVWIDYSLADLERERAGLRRLGF